MGPGKAAKRSQRTTLRDIQTLVGHHMGHNRQVRARLYQQSTRFEASKKRRVG